MKKTVTIQRQHGLHARPAAEFVKLATGFNSEIKIEYNDESVDAKSIMSIMGLGLSKGAEITLDIQGDDEADALAALDHFVAGE